MSFLDKNYNYLLISLIILLIIIFLLFDLKKTDVQKYLKNIHINSKKTKKKYPNIINPKKNMVLNKDVIYVENVLNNEYFKLIQKNFQDLSKYNSRNLGLRKADGVNFINLHKDKEYSTCLETYYNNQLLDYISDLVNKPLQRANSSDINACSLLIYSKEGDHIYWHIDNSIYYGDRYVVLFTIINENDTKNGLSNNEFYYKLNGVEHKLKMMPNSLLIFKGSDIMHKSTAIKKNEKRVLLSMTFCDICQEKKNIINYIHDKIKNLVTYG